MNLFKQYKQLKNISTASLLEESPQLPLIFWGVFVTAVIILALILWASFATIQEVATSYGEIIPIGHVQKVQHLEGGIVKSVLVSNGEEVRKGQLIIQMDETASKAELAEARSREIALILDKERLQAYIERQPANLVKWSQAVIQSKYNIVGRYDEINRLLQKEKALLDSQNEKRKNRREALEAQLEQKKTELKKYQHQLKVWARHLSLLTEEFEMYRKLRAENYVSHRDYLNILRDLNNAKGEQSRLITEISKLKEVIVEYHHKLKELDATFDAEALKELGIVDNKLLEERHEIERLENSLKHSDVYSPVTGIVKGLQVFASNVVKPGGLLVEIVPLNQEMVAETRIQPRDIGHIKIGDPVIVKALTYDYARYGSIKGKLIEISATTFLDENNKPYYKAVTKLNQQYLVHNNEKKYIKPGMTVTADIITGKKTLMQYLLKPIQTSTATAFRER